MDRVIAGAENCKASHSYAYQAITITQIRNATSGPKFITKPEKD